MDRIRGMYGIYLKLIKETPQKITTCNRLLDLEARGFNQLCPKTSPDTGSF
jgi:hypothetical protein